ncbi:MAG: proton-conducting transporter membrane subunit [Rikenellaceae bacterium]|nr:proton-conducting transporter membrane subunit [Rikenellaceae bacterium]
MEKFFVEILNLLAIAVVLVFPFLGTKSRGIITLIVLTLQAVFCSFVALSVFLYGSVEYSYPGSWISGDISVKIDYLSAWFMLLINFTFLTGTWYGFQYMKSYRDQSREIAFHAVALLFAYTSLIDICIVQNGFVMLVVWEIMALSSMVVIIFEHKKKETIKAGINFLIQSHICILLLTIGFMWVKIKTGSFDFAAITEYTANEPQSVGLGLFLVFFMGFAIKAGFVPFHTWLPLAHPAAPAHISGIMSGVIIKIGIYGIVRMLLLVKTDMISVGYFILAISVITGIYGVMLAIVQHNLKKLLAYHSIENIGIIGIGLGIGALGSGYGNSVMMVCGYGGALLHTLNHSLFKSLLFFAAGNVYQAIHSMNIDQMGGLIKKIPKSGYLFLVASLAICGLPPFNGFVSEFLIYTGLINGMMSTHYLSSLSILIAIIGLVLIGGLALLCFTKAFGIVFLGHSRNEDQECHLQESRGRIVPMYIIAFFIVAIGILPLLFMPAIMKLVSMFGPISVPAGVLGQITDTITIAGLCSAGFLVLVIIIYYISRKGFSGKRCVTAPTWGCGYMGDASGMQYTASSYVRSYRKIAGSILKVNKHKTEASGLYPVSVVHTTHPEDRIESGLIDKPLFILRWLLNRFAFLQNGNIQAYILYGLLFIGFALLIPFIAGHISEFFNLLLKI